MSSLYIPVHKRASSSGSRSPSCSSRESQSRSPSPPPSPHPQTYTISALLELAHSPSAHLPPQKRDALRAAFPDLVTNRKQRKAIEYHSHVAARAANNNNQPPRRTRPFARTPAVERKRNATRVLDEVSWRGRVPARAAVLPVPVSRAVAAAA